MKPQIENALFQCGRERVLHREDSSGASIAIRYDVPGGAASPDGVQQFLVRNAVTIDEAGQQAARAFAVHLRARARDIYEWADRIDRALGKETP